MTSDHAETTVPTAGQPIFHKVGENLYRLESSGGYYALLKRAGKQIRRSLKTNDPALARRRLSELRNKVAKLSKMTGASKTTFTELAERWVKNASASLKSSSALRLSVCVKGLEPFFKGIAVRNITAQHCENWLTKRGQEISPSSYKHERRALIALLDYAIRDGLILENPARDALPTRKLGKTKFVIPTRDQFRVLVEALRSADCRAQHAGNLVELLGYSGMRLQEALHLTWGDVDRDRNNFTVTGGAEGTKNHEIRVIPLFPAMRELLDRIQGDLEPAPDQHVIPITGPNGAATAIKTACKKAKLPHFLHHSMRHYFCSNAIEAGIDFKVIAGWLGHKDGGFLVAKTYGHLRDAHSFEMARRMTFSAVEPQPANVVSLPNALATAQI